MLERQRSWSPLQYVRVRLSDSSRLSEFIGFLAVPQLTLRRLDNDEIEIQPNRDEQDQRTDLLVELMLQAWNAAHAETAAHIVDDAR